MLTVETEVNGDTKRTNQTGFSLVGSLALACRYKRFLFSLAALVGPVQIHRTLFQFLCPHRPASKAGSRAGSPVS